MATDQIEILRGIRTGLVTHVDDLQVLINHAGTPEEQITLVTCSIPFGTPSTAFRR